MLNAIVPAVPKLDSETHLMIDADYWTYQLSSLLQHKDPNPERMTTAVVLNDGEVIHVEPEENLDYLILCQIRDLKYRFRTENLTIYLQGEGNFREQVAVTKPYKGGRTKRKPYYYQRCRDVLVNRYDAIIVHGYETDDAVCMGQYAHIQAGIPSVIVSPDKDLLNMFGYNYNPRTKTLRWITAEEAERHFWEQMVIGDNSVDNIPGVYRVGEKWVDQHGYLSNQHFIEEVMELYKQKHDINYMIEQGNLLHMCRTPDDIERWYPDYDYYQGYRDLIPIEYHPLEEE